jgi:hypothetical protein
MSSLSLVTRDAARPVPWLQLLILSTQQHAGLPAVLATARVSVACMHMHLAHADPAALCTSVYHTLCLKPAIGVHTMVLAGVW